MRRVIITASLLAPLFNPISAAAFQTEVKIQGITRTDERIERAKLEAKAARAASRADAEPAAPDYTTYDGGVIPAARVAEYARMAGFPESVIPTMIAIAWRESRFDPGAVNPFSGATGLWQIYPGGPQYLFPAANAAAAYAKWKAAGLAPWGMG